MEEGKTTLSFFGGIGQIGGNKIALMAGNNKGVFLDFGYNFKIAKKYYDQFVKPRKSEILIDGISNNMLPWPIDELKGIYRKDLYKNKEQRILKLFEEYKIENNITNELQLDCEPLIKDVLISHAHTDHIGDIKYLDPSIRLICSSITTTIIKKMDAIKKSNSLFGDISSYSPHFQSHLRTRNDGSEKIVRSKTEPAKIRKFKEISTGDSTLTADGGFKITYFNTDHSIPGAGAFLIEDLETKKKIVYTGDIRNHGPERENFEKFLEFAKKFKPDALVSEGTRVKFIHDENENENKNENIKKNEKNQVNESEVQDSIKKLLKKIKQNDPSKALFFSCSTRDLWRISSFYKASLTTERILVINAETYILLKELKKMNKTDFEIDLERIKVFLPRKGWGFYSNQDYSKSKIFSNLLMVSEDEVKKIEKRFSRTRKADFLNTQKSIIVNAEELHKNPNKYFVYLSYYNFNELFDIKPPVGSYYIISKSEPFDIEGEIREKKMLKWLKLIKFPSDHIFRFHCSGHATEKELIKMIKEIKPKTVFPIHTEAPQKFQELLGENIKVIIPEYGKKYIV